MLTPAFGCCVRSKRKPIIICLLFAEKEGRGWQCYAGGRGSKFVGVSSSSHVHVHKARKMADDRELEAIRARRMAELEAQFGAVSNYYSVFMIALLCVYSL